MPEKPTLLEQATTATVRAELDRIEQERRNQLQVDIDTESLEIGVQHTTESAWSFTAWAKKLWRGPWSAGGRIEKDF